MSCTKVLQVFGGHSTPQPVISSIPVDLAMCLCLSQSPPLCQLLGVSPMKPLRPCIHPSSREPASRQALPTPFPPDWAAGKKKRVVFADSKGLSLTAVRVFSARDEPPAPEPSLRLRPPHGLSGSDGKTGPRLGFQLPAADFQSFLARLREGLVLLESCSVTERALSGTVRVRNVSFQKAVHVRVTFDSWRSWRDVPCAFLHQPYGGPDTDVFAFDVPLPAALDPRERLEFCVSYLPGGHSTPLWDNNMGRNYSLVVGAESEAGVAPSCHGGIGKPKRRALLAGKGHCSPSLLSGAILVNQSWGRLENLTPFW